MLGREDVVFVVMGGGGWLVSLLFCCVVAPKVMRTGKVLKIGRLSYGETDYLHIDSPFGRALVAWLFRIPLIVVLFSHVAVAVVLCVTGVPQGATVPSWPLLVLRLLGFSAMLGLPASMIVWFLADLMGRWLR